MQRPRWRHRRPGRRMRLRLSHRGLHSVLGRMQPRHLRRLAGGTLRADPAPAVTRGIARIARRARWLRRFRPAGDVVLDVWAAPGYRILVRRDGELDGEIVDVVALEREGLWE
jgi:hypothetical protein